MKLSQAIRLGSMLRPQGHGHYFDGVRTCAMGAALEAIGALPRSGNDCLSNCMPFALAFIHCVPPKVPSGVTLGGDMQLAAAVAILNDAGWTREQIADWVETIEAQQAPEVQTVHCCVPTCRAVMVAGNSETVSHGLCQRCLAIEMAKLDAEVTA